MTRLNHTYIEELNGMVSVALTIRAAANSGKTRKETRRALAELGAAINIMVSESYTEDIDAAEQALKEIPGAGKR